MHRGINNKQVSLILTLLSVASNLMVNKNTVSQVTELLIRRQFKNSPLQFFTMFPSSAAAPIVDLFISVFVFTLRLAVVVFFLSFLFFFLTLFLEVECAGWVWVGWGGALGGAGGRWGAVFLHFSPFTSCESRRSHFLPVIRQCGASETAVSFKSDWVEWV